MVTVTYDVVNRRVLVDVALDLTEFIVEQRVPVPECDAGEQTDAFLAPEPHKPYVPKKTGIDAYTQIEDEDALFDFDVEVEPILDVMVGKILEQAVLELEQARELQSLSASKVRYRRFTRQAVPTLFISWVLPLPPCARALTHGRTRSYVCHAHGRTRVS
jgi:hypothetical protein